jgi:hypothetical protein
MKSVALLAAVAILGLSACGSGREEDSVPADRGVAAKGLPDVARLVCKENGTRVKPTTVKPQPDGVHLEVVNRVDERMRVNVGDKTDGTLYQGLDAPLGASEEVLDVRPGSIWLACRGPLADPAAQPAVLEVVDADNVWLEGTGTVPDCETSVSGISDYMLDTPGYPTPAEAVRHQFADAFEPGDVLEQLGYPEASPATLALVRDGVTAWGVTVTDSGRGWLVESDSRCG